VATVVQIVPRVLSNQAVTTERLVTNVPPIVGLMPARRLVQTVRPDILLMPAKAGARPVAAEHAPPAHVLPLLMAHVLPRTVPLAIQWPSMSLPPEVYRRHAA
jgi:hypothetical protein